MQRAALARIAVDAAPGADYYSAYAAPLDYLSSLLDRPALRDRVSAISIDLSQLDADDRELLTYILLRAEAIHQLRTRQPS